MKTSNQLRKKQLLALFMSVLMTSSVTALAACNESSSSSSSSSSSTTAEEKEGTLIKNGSFENFAFDTESDSMKLMGTSPSSWTRNNGSDTTGSAPSSKASSGIISTADADWKQLTTTTVDDAAKLTESEAESKWSTLTAKDKLIYTEAWKDANTSKTISEELDFYQSANIDSEDLPTCKNPLTHGDDAEDSNVLMIHNDYPTLNEYYFSGTAQYYTSSSTVTLKAGTAAKLSLWVKTSDLKMASLNEEGTPAINKGAYINVAHTVGSKTMPLFQVKNIDTKDVTENNGWEQYTFYVNSSSYADTTFTLTLGLGQGGSADKLNHVNGYAFFDDIECEVISRSEYTENVTSATEFDFAATEEEKTINAFENDKKSFALNMYGDFKNVSEDFYKAENFTFEATTESGKRGAVYTLGTGNPAYVKEGWTLYNGKGIDMSEDKLGIYTPAQMKTTDSKYLKQVYADYFEGNKFVGENDNVVMLMSAKGAASTASSKTTFTLPADKYTAISFFVRTSDMNGFTGAGITINDGANKTSLSAIDTTSITTVDINDDEKDIYDGWQQCLFYIKNETDTEKTFTLTFNYGLTNVIGNNLSSYYTGFASFTKFQQRDMDEDEFEVATSGTYAQVVSLTGATEEEVESSDSFDAVTTVPTGAIENGFANPKNYKGVYSDSQYVNTSVGGSTAINQNANAGLLNKKYAENYAELLKKMGGEEATWDSVFSDATQPLVIYNEEAQDKAYGFIGNTTTISANSYKTVSLRVKVSGDLASAFVYLIDTDDETRQSTLSIGRQVSYWYDDEGNACSKDPASHDFNEKKHVAFKLQANGLYKLNPKWEGYDLVADELKDAYFANLANYEVEENTNDLLVAEGGVSYNYTDALKQDGNDGKAYYSYNAENKTAYADSAKKTLVYDFAKANLTARYEANTNKNDMFFEVLNTNGEWATVTFYIHTGENAKNYRLEVWNGARNSSAANIPANSFVAFDSNEPDSIDADKYTNLVEERKDGLTENEDYFEDVFSFYDSAKFLRYDEYLDENDIGNSYDDYLSSAYTSGIAYLKYDEGNTYEMFADYALSETAVTADAAEEEDEEITSDHDHESETNVWLLASSIAIAVVLLVAMVSIIVQKAVRSYRKKNGIAPKKAKIKKEKKDN